MIKYRFHVEIKLRTPVISQGVGAPGFGLDSAAHRDRDGYPVLPGTLIRGNLRESWECFKELLDGSKSINIDRWLGSKESTDYEPDRGILMFSNTWRAERQDCESTVRNRISMEAETGTVKSRALQMIEMPYEVNQEVCYTGHIDVWCDEPASEELERWIYKGLEYVPSLGAFKGVGFGKITNISITKKNITPIYISSGQAQRGKSSGEIAIALHPDRSFCFARSRKPNENRFESEDFIPGAAIKGAMARMLKIKGGAARWGTVNKYFDALSVSHAQPVLIASQCRPVAMPLSLVFAPGPTGGKKLYDVACKEGPGLISGQAPVFSADWKSPQREDAAMACGWGETPGRTLQVRTSIDYDRGAAAENRLFSYETVEPEGRQWLARLILPPATMNINESGMFHRELVELLDCGLEQLGKTKASAKITILNMPLHYAVAEMPVLDEKNRAIVVLQSLARLLPVGVNAPGTGGGQELLELYQQSWAELSGGTLSLERFFACQKLVGGRYLWNRFLKSCNVSYNPIILTVPGSVFVLKAEKQDAATECLERWKREGLPQLKATPGGDKWNLNPYIAANGYGEIAVNLQLHRWLEPGEGVWNGLD